MRWLPLLLLVPLLACGDDDGSSFTSCDEDIDCDDGLFCNGTEVCNPDSPGANPRGCLAGASPCATTCDDALDMCMADCIDADGDGTADVACGGSDCNDADADVYPGNVEVCDGDDEDCDPTTLGDRDMDGDGFIDMACCNGSACGSDCDDSLAEVQPGQVEVCNDRDEDCDGTVDEGVLVEIWPDLDGDDFGDASAEPERSCIVPSGFASRGEDCDDANPFRRPGELDLCNGVDDDCDEIADESADLACAFLLGDTTAGGFCYGEGADAECRYGSCLAGLSDCDGLHQNGCETPVCSTAAHCNFCRDSCGAVCTDGTCPFTGGRGVAYPIVDSSGGAVEGAVAAAHETCQDSMGTSDSSGQVVLTSRSGDVGDHIRFDADGYLPALCPHGSVKRLFTRAEVEGWLSDPAAMRTWDERMGIVIVSVDRSLRPTDILLATDLPGGGSDIVPHPSDAAFRVAPDGSVGGSGRGRFIFTNVPAGPVRFLYAVPGCSLFCDGPTRLRVGAGRVTYTELTSCNIACA